MGSCHGVSCCYSVIAGKRDVHVDSKITSFVSLAATALKPYKVIENGCEELG